MKRWTLGVAAVSGAAVALLSACGEAAPPAAPDSTNAAADSAGSRPPAPAAASTNPRAPATTSTPAAAAGVPPFAAPYPGAQIQGQPLTSQNETERGGVVTFTTSDSPEEVITYYRGQAEAAGLASAMTMTQGETQVYGAQAEGSGASVQIVATPLGDATSVQLTWTSGG